MDLWLATFPEKDEILSGKSSRWRAKMAVDFFPKMLLGSVTLRYLCKGVSFMKSLLNKITESESLIGSEKYTI